MESTLASLGDWRKQRSEGAPELEAKLKAELEEAAATASPSKEREHWTSIVNKELDLSGLAAPEEMELKAAPALESARDARERIRKLLAEPGPLDPAEVHEALAAKAYDWSGDALKSAADQEMAELDKQLAELRAAHGSVDVGAWDKQLDDAERSADALAAEFAASDAAFDYEMAALAKVPLRSEEECAKLVRD
mmetsp:Transcript_24146/g.72446  ORF Transcript_24146/g.72446 Transcript_24146/m.72446 type:complete len:194 (-) Transcript_24146:16-597(-)